MNLIGEIAIGFTYTKAKNSDERRLLARIALPAELGQALKDAELNRAELFITEDGILLKPFKGEKKSHIQRRLMLPASWLDREPA